MPRCFFFFFLLKVSTEVSVLIHYCCSFLYGDFTFSLKCIIYCELCRCTGLVFLKAKLSFGVVLPWRSKAFGSSLQLVVNHVELVPLHPSLFCIVPQSSACLLAVLHGTGDLFFSFLLCSDRKLWSSSQCWCVQLFLCFLGSRPRLKCV